MANLDLDILLCFLHDFFWDMRREIRDLNYIDDKNLFIMGEIEEFSSVFNVFHEIALKHGVMLNNIKLGNLDIDMLKKNLPSDSQKKILKFIHDLSSYLKKRSKEIIKQNEFGKGQAYSIYWLINRFCNNAYTYKLSLGDINFVDIDRYIPGLGS